MSATKRREKAIARRNWHEELDVRWAFKLDRAPMRAGFVSYCSMPGATIDEERDWHQSEDDHASCCDPRDGDS